MFFFCFYILKYQTWLFHALHCKANIKDIIIIIISIIIIIMIMIIMCHDDDDDVFEKCRRIDTLNFILGTSLRNIPLCCYCQCSLPNSLFD
jgi:hypothetical protein